MQSGTTKAVASWGGEGLLERWSPFITAEPCPGCKEATRLYSDTWPLMTVNGDEPKGKLGMIKMTLVLQFHSVMSFPVPVYRMSHDNSPVE